MAASKYELIEQVTPNAALCRHRQLGRDVVMHAFQAKTLAHSAQLRRAASRLASADHPAMPHLIDFVRDTKQSYQVVLESHSTEALPRAVKHLSAASLARVLAGAADALVHAQQRDLAHGNLSLTSIQVDPTGQPKLSGIGLRQMSTETIDLRALQAKDLDDLISILQHCLKARGRSMESGDEDELRCVAELTKLAQAHTESTSSVARLADDLKRWLRHDEARRQQEALCFDVPSEPLEVNASRRLWLACIACALLAIVLAGFAAWPRDSMPLVAETPLPPAVPSHRAPVSRLQGVGTVNQTAFATGHASAAETTSALADSDATQTVTDADDKSSTAANHPDPAQDVADLAKADGAADHATTTAGAEVEPTVADDGPVRRNELRTRSQTLLRMCR